MNLLQMEFDVLPIKVLKEDKAEYIQATWNHMEAIRTEPMAIRNRNNHQN